MMQNRNDSLVKRRRIIETGRSRPLHFSTAVVFLFGFVCFFPNPALPIGSSTGLQAGQIVALLFLPALLIAGLPIRQTLLTLLLLFPMLLSGFLAVLSGRALSNEAIINATIAMASVLVVLIPVREVLHKRRTLTLLSGVAWAIIVNTVVGIYQVYSFARDEFPLLGLYQNPSFQGFIFNDDGENWATYVKRPFGLFPEPSAMAASIGPWLILFVGLLLYPKLGPVMTRGTRTQLLLATLSGVSLIFMSSSGFTVWLLISLLLVVLPTLKNKFLRLHRQSSWLALVTLVLMGAVLVDLSLNTVGPRLDVQENSSWSTRLASIVWGLAYLGTSVSNLLFGVGPGQSYATLQSSKALNFQLDSSGEVTAVFSVVVRHVQETGLVGALALTLILIMILRAILRSSARLLGLSSLLAWLAGVLFTTSYPNLLPIWLFLGLLVEWDRIFEAHAPQKDLGPEPGTSSVREALKT